MLVYIMQVALVHVKNYSIAILNFGLFKGKESHAIILWHSERVINTDKLVSYNKVS